MFRKVFRVVATLALVLATTAFLASGADAAAGSGFSMGSRGMRSFTPPPATSTAPMAAPLQRSTAPPAFNNPGFNNPGVPRYAPTGGFFGRPGFFGGLMTGFLGAGLFGLLFGHGFWGGVGGFFSFIGLIFQLGLIAFLAMFLWRMFQRREPAYAGPYYRDNVVRPAMFGGLGGGGSASARPAERSDEVGITGADYDAFERLLSEIQASYSAEDIAALRARATPEMVSYFSEDLASNASRGVVNRVSNVKLLQGDLAEAWREGDTEYATVAMRFSLVDCYFERATERVVEGDPTRPHETTEVWTFRRHRGSPWMLSAIQQTR